MTRSVTEPACGFYRVRDPPSCWNPRQKLELTTTHSTVHGDLADRFQGRRQLDPPDPGQRLGPARVQHWRSDLHNRREHPFDFSGGILRLGSGRRCRPAGPCVRDGPVCGSGRLAADEQLYVPGCARRTPTISLLILASADTIVVQSLSDPSMAGYTDMITIAPANSSSPSHVPASEIPSGTVASILTIPVPTSTDFGASTWYTGSTPAPTAVTGATSSPTTVANTPPPADSSGGLSTVSSQFSTAAAVSSLGTTHTTAGAAAAAAGSSTSPTSGALGSATAPASTYLALVASCVLALLA